jgi:hypothetical protein
MQKFEVKLKLATSTQHQTGRDYIDTLSQYSTMQKVQSQTMQQQQQQQQQ